MSERVYLVVFAVNQKTVHGSLVASGAAYFIRAAGPCQAYEEAVKKYVQAMQSQYSITIDPKSLSNKSVRMTELAKEELELLVAAARTEAEIKAD